MKLTVGEKTRLLDWCREAKLVLDNLEQLFTSDGHIDVSRTEALCTKFRQLGKNIYNEFLGDDSLS